MTHDGTSDQLTSKALVSIALAGGTVGIPLVELLFSKFPFYVLLNTYIYILIPYSRFSRIDQKDLEHFVARVLKMLLFFLIPLE